MDHIKRCPTRGFEPTTLQGIRKWHGSNSTYDDVQAVRVDVGQAAVQQHVAQEHARPARAAHGALLPLQPLHRLHLLWTHTRQTTPLMAWLSRSGTTAIWDE